MKAYKNFASILIFFQSIEEFITRKLYVIIREVYNFDCVSIDILFKKDDLRNNFLSEQLFEMFYYLMYRLISYRLIYR